MRAARLSIVTPTRHAPHLLDRLYQSLLYQTCPEFEHVLIDTSDDDRTHDRWCEDFAPHLDHRFRYARVHLAQPNMAQAYEYALRQATGSYVCPMTHKAMWRHDGIENIHRIIDRYPELPAFAFRSLYTAADIHQSTSDFRELPHFHFGSAWDGSAPVSHDSRALFLTITDLFGQHGYYGPHAIEHWKAPFACHAIYSRDLLTRVQDRFTTLVAGKFAGDSRLGYRVMDLEREVHHFPDFEPRVSSMASNTGAAGSQLQSWRYLREVFKTLDADTKEVMSRSPFGYLPLWCTMVFWEYFSITTEAQDRLKVDLSFDTDRVHEVLRSEIGVLTEIDEPQRAGLLRHADAIASRLPGGNLRKWF